MKIISQRLSYFLVFIFSTVIFTTSAFADTTKDGLSARVLAYAINGYRWAIKHNEVSNPFILTIIDFNKPSDEKRLWVIDLKNDRILMHTYVAQGKNTGKLYARHFSNKVDSYESSPGIFTTHNTIYDGQFGEALRVNGLENGINNNAYARAIVIHSAPYVTPAYIEEKGRAGRSYGCFALNPARVNRLVHLVRGGSVWFAYAKPEKYDVNVDHALSARGEQLFNAIMA